jgi:hypothetical protein
MISLRELDDLRRYPGRLTVAQRPSSRWARRCKFCTPQWRTEITSWKLGIAAVLLLGLQTGAAPAFAETRCVRNYDGSVTCRTYDRGGWGQYDMSREWCGGGR